MSIEDIASIIIPVKNEKRRIRIIIEGLYKQSYRPIEVIFVDGGSTDGTIEEILDAIRKYSANNFKIRLLRERDFGDVRSPPNARNIGALNASGKYVIFFDADFDLRSDEQVVEKIMQAFKKGVEHVMIRHIPAQHTWIEINRGRDDIVYYRNSKPIHELCGFVKDIVLKVKFNPNLGLGEDEDFLYRVRGLINPKYEIVDSNVIRCWPHTLKEYAKQQLWYGKTALSLYRYKGKNLLECIMGLVKMNALLIATLASAILFTLLLYSRNLTYFAFLLLTLTYVTIRLSLWLERDYSLFKSRRVLVDRFLWYLFRETYGRVIFDIGVLYGVMRRIISRSKYSLGK
jgi:glycosyltransferase involved in cell wall biosynthesis